MEALVCNAHETLCNTHVTVYNTHVTVRNPHETLSLENSLLLLSSLTLLFLLLINGTYNQTQIRAGSVQRTTHVAEFSTLSIVKCYCLRLKSN
jgi:hypothetical protein